MASSTVLITGGAGYIGAHCAKQFNDAGWDVIVFDNLSRGWRDFSRWGIFVEGDILDESSVLKAFKTYQPRLVVHLAALAYVGESMLSPDLYYRTNTVGSLNILSAMKAVGVTALVFSSTCATYGIPDLGLIAESHPQRPINPYGWSKFMVERFIESFSSAYDLRYVILRYFNAAGANMNAKIGERHEPETHAIPLALKGLLEPEYEFVIHGNDYPTRDGTCERDYIHVIDLANAHLSAANYLEAGGKSNAFNLGTGIGVTVRELIIAIESATEREIMWKVGPRRIGDPPTLVADGKKAKDFLGFEPKHSSIKRIVLDAWQWAQFDQTNNRIVPARGD